MSLSQNLFPNSSLTFCIHLCDKKLHPEVLIVLVTIFSRIVRKNPGRDLFQNFNIANNGIFLPPKVEQEKINISAGILYSETTYLLFHEDLKPEYSYCVYLCAHPE